MTIGSRISSLRKQLKFSQEYVAEQLGISRQAVSKWEKDITKPDTKNTVLLAELFNSSVEYILMGNESIPNEKTELPKNKKKKESFNNGNFCVFISFSGCGYLQHFCSC